SEHLRSEWPAGQAAGGGLSSMDVRQIKTMDCFAALSMNPCDKLLIRHRERSEAIQRFGSEFLDGHGPSGLAMTGGWQVHGPWALRNGRGISQ
ncbi:MAG TPA: hypothetical protein VFN29_08875, partial [Chiayiivirga sp.]|nr:hypothetical protein [Chiayiivirga sp.]